MTVYDCTQFLNENDLFEIRLNQHWNFVDKFIVVEAKQTHSGIPKPLNFDTERFKPYSSKIEYRVIENFDEEMAKYPWLDCKIGKSVHGNQLHWARDHFQINYTFKILLDLGAKDDDIVFVSSCDEIIYEDSFNRSLEIFQDKLKTYDGYDWVSKNILIQDIRPCFGFHLNFYVYKFNLLKAEAKDYVAALITEFSNFKKILPGTIRSYNVSTHNHIQNGGWHFSYADKTDGDMVMTKLKSWAHTHDTWVDGRTRAQIIDKDEALRFLNIEFPTSIVPIQRGTHPDYLVDNIEKFKDYLFKDK